MRKPKRGKDWHPTTGEWTDEEVDFYMKHGPFNQLKRSPFLSRMQGRPEKKALKPQES